jgi:predicted component of type VI protein secretion system
MDILEELEEKNRELTICYSVMQMQQQEIKKLAEQIQHLEKLLMHKAQIIDKDE